MVLGATSEVEYLPRDSDLLRHSIINWTACFVGVIEYNCDRRLRNTGLALLVDQFLKITGTDLRQQEYQIEIMCHRKSSRGRSFMALPLRGLLFLIRSK